MAAAALLLLWAGLTSSCTSGGGTGGSVTLSMEARVYLAVLDLMNVDEDSLNRLKAGKTILDDAAIRHEPDQAYRERFAVSAPTVRGRKVWVTSPTTGEPRCTVFFIHGGAYSVGFNASHWDWMAFLAASGCRVVAPDYPLPPEAGWEESWAMVEAAWAREVRDSPGKAPILMGDSAGGGFALGLAQKLVAVGAVVPRRLILLSPWLDVTMENPAIAAAASLDPMLDPAALRLSARRWAGDTDLADWHLSPLNGRLEGLPPVVVLTGTADILNPDAGRFRELASARGLALDWMEYPGMFHVWMLFDIPESRHARDRLQKFLQ